MVKQKTLPPMLRHLFANANISTRPIVIDDDFKREVDAEVQKFLEEQAREKAEREATLSGT